MTTHEIHTLEDPREARITGKKLREAWARNGINIKQAALDVLRNNLVNRITGSYTIISLLSGIFGPSCDAYINLINGFLAYSHCNPSITIKVYGDITYYLVIGNVVSVLRPIKLIGLDMCTDDLSICSIGARLRDGREVFSLIKAKSVELIEP